MIILMNKLNGLTAAKPGSPDIFCLVQSNSLQLLMCGFYYAFSFQVVAK